MRACEGKVPSCNVLYLVGLREGQVSVYSLLIVPIGTRYLAMVSTLWQSLKKILDWWSRFSVDRFE